MDSDTLAKELGLPPERVWFASPDQPARERANSGAALAKTGPLVIAADSQYHDVRSSSCPGVEVLKWLRLKHEATKPILLVGFQSVEEILARHPEHLILLAPGNRYERLPLAPERIESLAQWFSAPSILEEAEGLRQHRPFVLPAYDEARFKHRLTNLWGIQRLRAIDNLISDTEPANGTGDDDPLELYMLQCLLASPGDDDEAWIAETRRARTRLRNRTDQTSVRVMLIDDQAYDGWAELYDTTLYGKPGECRLIVYPPKREDMKDSDVFSPEKVTAAVKLQKPDIILLDLRLSPSDQQAVVEDLSGAVLLERIRMADPAVPVIITTASGRAESLERLQYLGCDGYWMKEDVASPSSMARAATNYIRLMELVAAMTSPLWAEARTLGRHIVELEDMKGMRWWEKGPGLSSGLVGMERKEFAGIMREALFLLRDYLAMSSLALRKGVVFNKWFYPSLIVQHLSKLIEAVHGTSKREDLLKVDDLGSKLFIGRNTSSHLVKISSIPHVSSLDEAQLIEWLTMFRQWTLELHPPEVRGIKDTGIRIDVSGYKRPVKGNKHGEGKG